VPRDLGLATAVLQLTVLGSKTSVGLSPPRAVAPETLGKERVKGLWTQNPWKLHPAASTAEAPSPERPLGAEGLHGRCNGCHQLIGSISQQGGESLEAMDSAPRLGPTHPPNSQYQHSGSEEGEEWMRNPPCLPKDTREGSVKGCCHTVGKHRAWRAAASRRPAPAGHTTGYLTGQLGGQWLVVLLIIYSRYYKSSP